MAKVNHLVIGSVYKRYYMRRKNIFTIVAAAFLFLALFDGWPYGYFTLLRFVVCAVTAYCAYLAYDTKQEKWAWMFGIIAVLFNPFIPVHLDRETWTFIDFGVAVFLVISSFSFKVDDRGRGIEQK